MLKENLRKAVKASGLYVKEVSAHSGVSKRTIDKWLEVEGLNPRAIDLYKVSRTLKKTVEELLTGRTPEGIQAETLELARTIMKLSYPLFFFQFAECHIQGVVRGLLRNCLFKAFKIRITQGHRQAPENTVSYHVCLSRCS
jgi:transcriptional regulator with XRE-family HTH domain